MGVKFYDSGIWKEIGYNATKLAIPVKINNVSFDGSADITVYDNTKLSLSGGTLTDTLTTTTVITNLGIEPDGALGANIGNSLKPYDSMYGNELYLLSAASTNKIILTASDVVPNIRPSINNTGTLGTASNLWNNIYATTITGNLVGTSSAADKLSSVKNIAVTGAIEGNTDFDLSTNISINTTLSDFDAVKITSGTIDIARLPVGVLERLTVVENETARFALTINDVQVGDTVKQNDNNLIYYVKDSLNLDNNDGYENYTTGNATSVPWTGIIDKPTTLAGYGITDASALTHVHGNITNVGAIGDTSGLMIKTTTSGVLTALVAGTSGQYLQYNGTWATPPDTNTMQTFTTTNAAYPLLFSYTADKNTTSATSARISNLFEANPSTGELTATAFIGNITGNLTGTASNATSDSIGNNISTYYSPATHTHNIFTKLHALNIAGIELNNSPFTAVSSTSSIKIKAGDNITLDMDTNGVISIGGVNSYTHPAYDARSITIDTDGVDVLDTLNITVNTLGHASVANAGKRTLPSSSSTVTGVLTNTNWATFDGKIDGLTSVTQGYIPTWGANGKTLATGYSVETTMTGSSTALIRADAVKTYIDNVISVADALVYKGVIACAGNPNYPAGDKGHVYKVTSAGKIGGTSGVIVEIGDMLICNTDSTLTGTQATVGSKWDIIQTNIDVSQLQPIDGDLTAIAGLTTTGIAVRTATDTWATRKLIGGAGITITNDTGVSGDITITHADPSSQATVTNTGRTYIQSVTLDTMGHITGLTSASESVVNTDTLVTQTATTTNSTYPLLFTNIVDKTVTSTDTIRFATTIKANPLTGILTAIGFNGALVGNVTGNLTGNVDGTATKATQDASGNTITSYYSPTTHTHGNITNVGAIGDTSGLMIKTTTSGVLTALVAGTSGQYLQYNGTWATPPDTNTIYSLPTASSTVLGGVQIGTNLTITNGILSADAQPYNLPTASDSVLGGIKVGTNLSILNGILSSADTIYTHPTGVISTPGTYKSVTVNTNGHITAGTNPTTLSGYGITDASISTHIHGNITNDGKIGVTSSIPLITGTDGIIQAGSFGTTAGTFCVGNDSRLSDVRTPASHVHGNVTNAGTIGTTTDLIIKTTTSGVLTALAAGTTAQYLRGDGTWATPPNDNTDTKVTQTVTAANATYPLLCVGTTDQTTTSTNTTNFSVSAKINTSTGLITSTGGFSGPLTGNVTGTATPLSHTHGSISNTGAIGTTTGLIIKTTTSGVLTTLAAGTTAQYLRGDGTWANPASASVYDVTNVYTATAGQTLFDITAIWTDTNNIVTVYIDGLRALETIDYTKNSTTKKITLNSAAEVGEHILVTVSAISPIDIVLPTYYLASPAFTGTPTAPTATAGTNNTQIATTAFVTQALSTKPSLGLVIALS